MVKMISFRRADPSLIFTRSGLSREIRVQNSELSVPFLHCDCTREIEASIEQIARPTVDGFGEQFFIQKSFPAEQIEIG
jgi:hypothetical protein